jgi:hypothetical protein
MGESWGIYFYVVLPTSWQLLCCHEASCWWLQDTLYPSIDFYEHTKVYSCHSEEYLKIIISSHFHLCMTLRILWTHFLGTHIRNPELVKSSFLKMSTCIQRTLLSLTPAIHVWISTCLVDFLLSCPDLNWQWGPDIAKGDIFIATCHFFFGLQMWMNVTLQESVVQGHVTTMLATILVSVLLTTCKWMGEIIAWVSPSFSQSCMFGSHLQNPVRQLGLSAVLLIRWRGLSYFYCLSKSLFPCAPSAWHFSPPHVGGWEFSLKCNLENPKQQFNSTSFVWLLGVSSYNYIYSTDLEY